MIRYYACVIYCTLKLSRSHYKRFFIRYGGWTFDMVCISTCVVLLLSVDVGQGHLEIKKNKGVYSLIHGTMIKILYSFICTIYYVKDFLIHSRDNTHSGGGDTSSSQ